MTKRIISYFRQVLVPGFALMLLLLHTSCGASQSGQTTLSNPTSVEACNPDSIPPPRSAFTIEEGPITQIAAEVGKGVGKIIASGQGSKNRTIYVFEEKHDSRIGQLEIALMLWRLQKNQGLRQISLEGAFAADGDLPAKWFHDLTGSATAQQTGRETALSLLREGEINSAEFIALAQPAVHVKGNEIKSEYNVEPSKTNSALGYLVGIAEKSLTPSDARRVNDLIGAKNIEEALKVIFSNDPWSKDRYQKLYGDNIASTEESVAILREIDKKAKDLGINLASQQEVGFNEDLNFYQTASKRSCTIVKNTLAMMDATSAAPMALIIGAAHTPKVVELIKAAQFNYVVISPLSLVTPTTASKMTGPMYSRKSNLKSIDDERMLGALLDGRKKPPTVLWKKWFQSKAEIYASTDLIVAAAARKEQIPSDVIRKELQPLQAIEIDWSSIKISKEGNQVRVIYKVTAQTSDTDPKKTVTIWVGGWMQPPTPPGEPPVSPSSPDDDFERLILAALDEDRKKRPIDNPTTPPGKVAVVQLSTKTRAAFSTDPALLQQVTVAR
jgi:hypothetical protein